MAPCLTVSIQTVERSTPGGAGGSRERPRVTPTTTITPPMDYIVKRIRLFRAASLRGISMESPVLHLRGKRVARTWAYSKFFIIINLFDDTIFQGSLNCPLVKFVCPKTDTCKRIKKSGCKRSLKPLSTFIKLIPCVCCLTPCCSRSFLDVPCQRPIHSLYGLMCKAV